LTVAFAGVTQDVDVGIPDCRDHPCRLIVRQPKAGVGRGNDEIQSAKLGGCEIDRPVEGNVGLHAGEHHESAVELLIHLIDLLPLAGQVGDRKPTGHRQAGTMIRHRSVLVTERHAGVGHVDDRQRPVAPLRMHLKVSPIACPGRPDESIITERGHHLGKAHEIDPQRSPLLDHRTLSARENRGLHGGRRAQFEDLLHHSQGFGSDVRNLGKLTARLHPQ